MKRSLLLALVLALTGCIQQPTPVVVEKEVVITATPVPPTAASPPPTPNIQQTVDAMVEAAVKETVTSREAVATARVDTPVPPTATVTSVAGTVQYREAEGGVPYSGTTLAFDVAPGQVVIVTGGRSSDYGVDVSGEAKTGSVWLFYNPTTDLVISGELSNLTAGANWMAEVDNGVAILDTIGDERVTAMQSFPNCADGNGCDIVHLIKVNLATGEVDHEVR